MNRCTAIISGASVSLAPYLKYYIDLLNENNLNYILINVEETGPEINDSQHQIVFRCPVRPGFIAHIHRSLIGFIFILENLRKHKCKRIIVAPTRTGIKLRPLLILFYRNRYIFDIRDFTNEENRAYKKKEDRLIAASAATFISSRGFLQWISPSEKLRVSHNMPLSYCERPAPRLFGRQIRIGSVGMVSYYRENRVLIDRLGGDSDYDLSYYGDRTSEWSDVIVAEIQNRYDNVHFFDHFDNSNKSILYEKIDMINGLYGSLFINTKTLTPNRLYDAAIFKIPIIVSSGTWVAECVEKYGIGLSVNVFEDDIAKKLADYFAGFDENKFVDGCRRLLDVATTEQRKNSNWILQFLR